MTNKLSDSYRIDHLNSEGITLREALADIAGRTGVISFHTGTCGEHFGMGYLTRDGETGSDILVVVRKNNADPISGQYPECHVLDGSRYSLVEMNFMTPGEAELSRETGRVIVITDPGSGQTRFIPATGLSPDYSFLGLKGEAPRRNNLFAMGDVAYAAAGRKLTLIYRTDGADCKVFGMRSGTYSYFDQLSVFDFMSGIFADGNICEWEITQDRSAWSWEYPEKAVTLKLRNTEMAFVPGIHAENSDTGERSFQCHLSWNCGGHRVYLASGSNSVYRKHTGTWEHGQEDFARQAGSLLGKFTVLPDRLRELDGETVLWQDIENVVRNYCADTRLKELKGIGTRLADKVSTRFAGVSDVSAADIIATVIELQDDPFFRRNYTASQMELYREALGELPYLQIRRV